MHFSTYKVGRPSIPPDVPSAAGYISIGLTVITLLLGSVAAWITHIVVSIKAASWWLLFAGILAPPVGVIHGVGVWFGVF